MLFVVGLVGVVSAVAVPMMSNALGYYRISGDAREVSNSLSVAKLRAASDFTQGRLYVDLSAKSFHVEVWQKTGVVGWVTEGGTTGLSTSVAFGFGVVPTPPPDTQGAIGEASACVDAAGTAIANTACVLFNSRGIPVDPSGAPPNVGSPTANDVVYLTDGLAVYAVSVSATGLIQLWRTNAAATPIWSTQ
jgi:hypothetical protein